MIAMLLMRPVYAETLSAEELTNGKWLCEGSYRSIAPLTVDEYEYRADGSSTSKGVIFISMVENALFKYKIERTGRWTLKDNVLTEVVKIDSVTRHHVDNVINEMKKHPKLAQLENAFYTTLLGAQTDADNTAAVKINKVDDDAFSVQQINRDGSLSETKGMCVRLKD